MEAEAPANTPILGTLAGCCASAKSGAVRRTKARVMLSKISLGFILTSFLKTYLFFVKKGQF
jgi:hypothetical protein